jgi:electron transport complex protein RnfD
MAEESGAPAEAEGGTQGRPAPVLHVAPSPHVFDSSQTTRKMMIDVLVALGPVVAMSIYVFRLYAVMQILICVSSALVAEGLFTAMRGKRLTLHDSSAAVTGLILALSLPGTAPWYIGVIGAFVAIGIGKVIFGGLGQNIFNPAMVGRAFVMLAFAGAVGANGYVLKAQPEDQPAILRAAGTSDAITSATPMTLAKTAAAKLESGEKLTAQEENLPSLQNLFIGTVNGSLGETSFLACLIGGLYLLIRRTISWHIPVGVLAAAAAIALAAEYLGGARISVGYHLFGGALMFGAIFIATDLVTSPLTHKGKLIFGLGVGALVMLFRTLSNYPEGVMFAVLIMNGLAPLINNWTIPKPLGGPVPEKK